MEERLKTALDRDYGTTKQWGEVLRSSAERL